MASASTGASATSEIDIRADPEGARRASRRSGIRRRRGWRSPASNNNALAGSDEDRPGEWNTLELVCIEDRCVHIANGKVVMALKNARYQDGEKVVPMTGGKLQIQSEAAEVFYRDLEIRSIPAMPAEYAAVLQGLTVGVDLQRLNSRPPFTTTDTF